MTTRVGLVIGPLPSNYFFIHWMKVIVTYVISLIQNIYKTTLTVCMSASMSVELLCFHLPRMKNISTRDFCFCSTLLRHVYCARQYLSYVLVWWYHKKTGVKCCFSCWYGIGTKVLALVITLVVTCVYQRWTAWQCSLSLVPLLPPVASDHGGWNDLHLGN